MMSPQTLENVRFSKNYVKIHCAAALRSRGTPVPGLRIGGLAGWRAGGLQLEGWSGWKLRWFRMFKINRGPRNSFAEVV